MAIYVNILNDNQLIKLEKSNLNTKIFFVKQEIKEKVFIPINEQIIYYDSHILDDYKKIADFTSDNMITLNLLIKEIPFQIIIKNYTGKEIIIKNITSQILVEEIFFILFYYYDLHPEDINIIFNSKVLDKSKKISYYNLTDNSVLNITIKVKTGF